MSWFEHHVAMVPYTEELGQLKLEKVALFDERDFTDKEINQIIRLHSVDTEYRGVIMVSKETYEQVFRSLITKGG